MAVRVFQGSGSNFVAANSNLVVRGAGGGNERLLLESNVQGVNTDANLERLELPGNLADYRFLVIAGVGLQIQNTTGTVIATTPSLNQNLTLAFKDGSATLIQTGATKFLLGGQTISAVNASTLSSATLGQNFNAADKSIAGTGTTVNSTTSSKVLIGSNDSFTAANENLNIIGAGSGNEKLLLRPDLRGITTDANIERLELAGNLADYQWIAVAGKGLQIQNSAGLVLVTTPSLNQDMSVAFADGSATMTQTGATSFSLGGKAVSTASSTLFSAATLGTGFNSTDKSTVGTSTSTGGTGTDGTGTGGTGTGGTGTGGTGTGGTGTGGTGTGSTSLLTTAQSKSYTDNNIDTLPSANDSLVRTVATSFVWQKQALTYGFNQTLPSEYLTDNDLKGQINQWQKLNTTEANVARAAIDRLGQLTPLTFTEASGNNGDIRFNVIYIPGDTAGFAYMPTNGGTTAVEGDVFLDSEMRSAYKFAAGDQGYMTVWHELGHAMGLEHPFEAVPALSSTLDNWANSIMSYTPSNSLVLNFSVSGNSSNVKADYDAAPADFTLLDVAALQAMYGANTNYATGDNTYRVDAVNKKTLTIWDAGGNDTIDASTATGQSIIDMRPGQLASIDIQTIAMQAAVTKAYYQSMGLNGMDSWVDSVYATPEYASKLYTGENNLVITYGTIIENVKTGAGNDTVKDNAVNNTIITGSGDDMIYLGRGGFDTVNGGSGTDMVYLEVLKADVQTEKLDNGNFLLVGSGFAAELIGVEQIRYGNGEIFTVV